MGFGIRDLHLNLNCQQFNSLRLGLNLPSPQFSHHKVAVITPTSQGSCEIKGDNG